MLTFLEMACFKSRGDEAFNEAFARNEGKARKSFGNVVLSCNLAVFCWAPAWQKRNIHPGQKAISTHEHFRLLVS